MAGYGLSSYETIPYVGQPFGETHPDRLATIAALFGLKPPSVPRARVLEIGCGVGANIIPMAAELPEGVFLGIEKSERQVAEGRATIEAAGLRNVELRQMDLLDAGPDLGTFDYIICHGVFSWVADPVRQKILSVIQASLAPDGVAYVSYNTYPGWLTQRLLRDAMLFHIDGEADPREGIRKGREMLDLLVQFEAKPETAHATMVRSLSAGLIPREDSYLLHDYLEEVNQPLYYHQFLERVAAEGLKVLADAEFSGMACVAPGPVKTALGRMSDDPARQEEYLDYLSGRTFRRSLLCREGVELLPGPSPEAVDGLWAALSLVPGALSPDLSVGEVGTLGTERGHSIVIDHPTLKAAVLILSEHWPRAVPFRALWPAIAARVSNAGLSASICGEPQRKRLAEFLLQGYGSGWIELHSHMAPFVLTPGERPATTSLARQQARSGVVVANLRHESFGLSRFDRHLVELLDGHRSQSALVEALDALVAEGKLTIRGSDSDPFDTTSRRAILAESLRQGLARLASRALLVA